MTEIERGAESQVLSPVHCGAHRGNNPAHLPGQLLEVLRSNTMRFDQVHTYFGVKYRQQLQGRLKDAGADTLREYCGRLAALFDVRGDCVSAKPRLQGAERPTLASIRYADISRGVRAILEAAPGYRLPLTDIEAAFELRHGLTIVSVVGMSMEEYLARKPQIFGVEGTAAFLQRGFVERLRARSEDEEGAPASKPETEPAHGPGSPTHDQAKSPKLPAAAVSPAPGPVDGAQLAGAAAGGAAAEDGTNPGSATPGHDEDFVVRELAKIFQDQAEGPIMHSSVLCSIFMQRHGTSVTDITGVRPAELCRRHPETFLWLCSGNVALSQDGEHPAVQAELRLLQEQPKSMRVQVAAAEARLPVPEQISDDDVVDYMVKVLSEGGEDRTSVYISALCGRFMQRFKKPVSDVTGCRPTDFLKRRKDIFYLEKGGHVRLVPGFVATRVCVPKEEEEEEEENDEEDEEKHDQHGGQEERTSAGPAADEVSDIVPPVCSTASSVTHSHITADTGSASPAASTVSSSSKSFGDVDEEMDAKVVEDQPKDALEQLSDADVIKYLIEVINEISDDGAPVYISALCGRFMQRFNQPITAVTGSRPSVFLKAHSDIFELQKGGYVQLATRAASNCAVERTEEHVSVSSPDQPAAIPVPAATGSPVELMAPNSAATSSSTEAEIAVPDEPPADPVAAEITIADAVMASISSCLFLKVTKVQISNRAGDESEAEEGMEAVAFVEGLPLEGISDVLPPLLDAMGKVLTIRTGRPARIVRDFGRFPCLSCCLPALGADGALPSPPLRVHLAPAEGLRMERLAATMRELPPADRSVWEPALFGRRARLIRRRVPLGGPAANLAQRLKAWAAARTWSSPSCRPTTYLLDLLAIWAVAMSASQGHSRTGDCAADAARAATDALRSFSALHVTWEGLGVADHAWPLEPALGERRPLLLDPTCPALNAADPSKFDCSELMNFARAESDGFLS